MMEPGEIVPVHPDLIPRVDVPLFLKTLDAMEQNIERVNMRDYEGKSDCGTTHCFAGWVNVLTGSSNEFSSIARTKARESLGLTSDEGYDLFFCSDWPRGFRNMIEKEIPGTPEYFAVVKDRFLYFLETGK